VAKNKKQKLGNNENAYQEEFAEETNYANGASNKAGKNSKPSKA